MNNRKRSFQPPAVPAQALEPGAGFRIPKFPRPTVRTEGSPPEAATEEGGLPSTQPSPTLPVASYRSAIEAELVGEEDPTPVLIEIASIRRSRYQNRRRIDAAYVADLAENIRVDSLNNPIIVRPLDDGLFELVTGEHRVEAYKLNGETRIPARVRRLDERQAVRAVVLDNHFHRPPYDYERYVGYKLMLDADAVSSRRALASLVGFSHAHINRLMAFGELPPDAQALLDLHPELIGAALAESLAACCDSDAGREAVTEAIKKIAAKELTQARAVSWVQGRVGGRTTKSSRVLTSPQGKPFCTVAREGQGIRIKLASGIDGAALEEAVFDLLRSRAAEGTTASQGPEGSDVR